MIEVNIQHMRRHCSSSGMPVSGFEKELSFLSIDVILIIVERPLEL